MGPGVADIPWLIICSCHQQATTYIPVDAVCVLFASYAPLKSIEDGLKLEDGLIPTHTRLKRRRGIFPESPIKIRTRSFDCSLSVRLGAIEGSEA